MTARHFLHAAIATLIALSTTSCRKPYSDKVQGYVEGEYVYVASPLAGSLEVLSVKRGAQVKQGDPLFTLESGAETAAHTEAARKLDEGKAQLEDARKGKRAPEIAALEAQLNQARAAQVLSEKEIKRQADLSKNGVTSPSDLDKARSQRDQDRQRVEQLENDITTANLGMRADQIAAAEAHANALTAALAKADWDLSQKKQPAPRAGLVFDTLFRAGEWVAAGKPVVSLLPPENIKVRAFVPEQQVGTLQPGGTAQVHVDGVADSFTGTISYISPKAEYTPPVIYSQESRGKLVFMVELTFAPDAAAKLHPGQPVDVAFRP